MSKIWTLIIQNVPAITIVPFIVSFLIKRHFAQNQLKLDEELEQIKSKLDMKNHVSRVRFDAEFALYRELSAACCEMVSAVSALYPTLEYILPDKSKIDEYYRSKYKTASSARNKFRQLNSASAPFIPENFYKLFDELIELCDQNLFVFEQRWNKSWIGGWKNSPEKPKQEDKAYQRTGEIQDKFSELIGYMREYLKKLEVTG